MKSGNVTIGSSSIDDQYSETYTSNNNELVLKYAATRVLDGVMPEMVRQTSIWKI